MIREIVIFALCVLPGPLLVLFHVLPGGSWNTWVVFLTREVFSAGGEPFGAAVALGVRLLTPYLVIQSVRIFRWSQRSMTGRKWGNLYFAVMLLVIAGWSSWRVLDLLYFMYALGDIPGELRQFLDLEGINLLISLCSIFLGIRSFRIFLDPSRGASRFRRAPSEGRTNR